MAACYHDAPDEVRTEGGQLLGHQCRVCHTVTTIHSCTHCGGNYTAPLKGTASGYCAKAECDTKRKETRKAAR